MSTGDSGSRISVETPRQPGSAPFDPEPEREKRRGQLAILLVFTLMGTLVAMFTLAGGGWVSLSDSIPILATLVGLVGGALGFYFGSARHGSVVHQGGPSAPPGSPD